MIEPPDSNRRGNDLEPLYLKAQKVLAGLDGLGLYEAGAHLSMAMETMRRLHPDLPTID